MKSKTLLVLLVIGFSIPGSAQVLKNIGNKAKQKLEQKANEKVDKSIDEAVDGKTNEKKSGNEAVKNASYEETSPKSEEQPPAELLKAYSKYDFIQGAKVIAYEDFSNAAIGDFPTRWNTDGSAEIVSLNKKEGKWLRIADKGIFFPEFIQNLPDNSTLEFDLGVNNDFQWASGQLMMEITHFEKRDEFTRSSSNPTLHFEFHPLTGENYTGSVSFRTENAPTPLSNEAHIKNWDAKSNLFAHISIWRQGQRMRMYVNGNKLFDMPKAFAANSKFTDIIFQVYNLQTTKGDYYLIGNMRLAEGAPDTRNKLVTEGRFVTSGITFDVNSDRIKPDSYGVLKEIASVMKDNADLKVQIIGHTDSDGEESRNMELSKSRALAVKKTLSADFGVEESRMTTDGKGESKPVADNQTTEGKAQNRRVEFVKL